MYLALMFPFFFSGLIFTTLFSVYSEKIQILYLWDLGGGAIGCILLLPFLPEIGPGGLVFLSAGLILVASALFSRRHTWILGSLCVAAVLFAVPFVVEHSSIDFRLHDDKREAKSDIAKGRLEFSRWDPISKIDVIDKTKEGMKHIAYDGGSQSSHIYPFNGDYEHLRNNLFNLVEKHFWFRGVLASHYLKRDTGHKVLVIGSAGGQEVKAALMFGAKRVDAIEMVGTVVEVGKNLYSDYNGAIYKHPAVHASVGEGRSFLRQSNDKYDVIQIFSNHTSSSIAAGSGAIATVYLQTVEAYKEYFTHLTTDGVLQVNHHAYPRMITTASAAWKELGGSDFQKHVAVFERPNRQDDLPTMLIKMSEWKKEEIADLVSFFSVPAKDPGISRIVENPMDPGSSFLSQEFYAGKLPASLMEDMEFNVRPPMDDRPFFNSLRKRVERLVPSHERYLNFSTAEILNSSLKKGFIPLEIVHLPITAAVSIFYALIFIIVPLRFSEAGRLPWKGKPSVLVYFSCLGAGFIIFELVFVQIFMKLVGYPLYTYSTVIFTMLISAGAGSFASKSIVSNNKNRWYIPFIGIILTALLIIIGNQYIFNQFLSTSTPTRVLVCFLMILPLGFFLGMPFPLGILELETKPRGAIAWAWGINGLFTVIGGLSSVILSLIFGFRISLSFALLLYLVAFALFPRLLPERQGR
jgi:spermidine synthase